VQPRSSADNAVADFADTNEDASRLFIGGVPAVEADWIPYNELEPGLADQLDPHNGLDASVESDDDADGNDNAQEPQNTQDEGDGARNNDVEDAGHQPSAKKKRKTRGAMFDFEWVFYMSPSKKRTQRVAISAYPFRFCCMAPCSCSTPQFYQFRHHIKSHEGLSASDVQQHVAHEAYRLLAMYHADRGASKVIVYLLHVLFVLMYRFFRHNTTGYASSFESTRHCPSSRTCCRTR
jgi:hypothetical protein